MTAGAHLASVFNDARRRSALLQHAHQRRQGRLRLGQLSLHVSHMHVCREPAEKGTAWGSLQSSAARFRLRLSMGRHITHCGKIGLVQVVCLHLP